MNSFRELLIALMPDCDGTGEVFHLNCGDRKLTARDGEGKALLEVSSDGQCARREYEYDEACRVLSALKEGTAALNVWFPPAKNKASAEGSKAGRIIGILFGLALALGAGFCSFAILVYYLTAQDESALLFSSAQIFFVGMMIAGITLACAAAKRKLTAKKFFGAGGGFFLFILFLSLILGIWSTRATDPATPLVDYIVMTVFFGLFAAAGAALMIYTLISDSNPSAFTGYAAMPSIRVEPSPEFLAPVVAAIKERTACEAIRIKLDFDRQPALFDSKLGGLPYWDTSMSYPCDEQSGQKLAMLAQINLSQLPENDFFPAEGILQFFILPDIEYGISSTKKVIYHKTVNRSVYAKEIRELGLPCTEDAEYEDFPVTGEIAMNFEKVTTFMTDSDGRFDRLLNETAAQMGVDLFDGASYGYISEAAGDDFSEESTGHHIGGYPYFTQYDPRCEEEFDKYDFLLLQIDSDDKVGRPDKEVMWGDGGVGQFFISREALRAMELGDIYYTWDCC